MTELEITNNLAEFLNGFFRLPLKLEDCREESEEFLQRSCPPGPIGFPLTEYSLVCTVPDHVRDQLEFARDGS